MLIVLLPIENQLSVLIIATRDLQERILTAAWTEDQSEILGYLLTGRALQYVLLDLLDFISVNTHKRNAHDKGDILNCKVSREQFYSLFSL